jgi:hypothetical protein
LREALDVVPEGLIRLLAAVLEVLGVFRAHAGALEVPHEDLVEVHRASYAVGREVL